MISILVLENGKMKNVHWKNTNKLLWQGWKGGKTGFTDTAGPCLMAILKFPLEMYNVSGELQAHYFSLDHTILHMNVVEMILLFKDFLGMSLKLRTCNF